MIRLTEQTDCYRLEASSIEETIFCACIGTGGFLGLIVMLPLLRYSTLIPAIIGMTGCAGIGVFGCIASERYRSARGVLEIAIHGGQARWASGRRPNLGPWTPVSRFETVRTETDQFSFRALLLDGADVRPLGAWVTGRGRMMESFVRRMNELLCAEAPGPTISAPSVPVRTWRCSQWGATGPYRIEVRWAGPGIPGEVLVPLLIACFGGIIAALAHRDGGGWACLCLATLAVLAAVQVSFRWGTAWVEVLDRGGPVRWGSDGVPGQDAAVEVERFEKKSSFLRRPGYRVVAILKDGEERNVFCPWRTGRALIAEAITSELNHLLVRAPRPPSGA